MLDTSLSIEFGFFLLQKQIINDFSLGRIFNYIVIHLKLNHIKSIEKVFKHTKISSFLSDSVIQRNCGGNAINITDNILNIIHIYKYKINIQ